ncbi:glycosyltransferase family 4 protein [bacterium]|nr:glycosyltransferase family 4 protein [bacterium]
MKILCVNPDDLSTLLFCKTLSRLLKQIPGVKLVTVGGVVEGLSADMYREELKNEVLSTHRELPMKRFISPLSDLRYFFKLYKMMREEKCDAVITFTTKPNIYGQFAAFFAGIPLRVMAVRGLGRTFNAPSSFKESLLQGLMTILYKLSCLATHKVWFTNPRDLSDFVSQRLVTQEKTFMTQNAVDLTDFCMERIDPAKLKNMRKELGIPEECQIVIMVARLIEQKGVKEFAEAAVQLHKTLPHLYFLLVAPEEPSNPSIVPVSYIRGMESMSHLKWLGFRKDVRELYALSDISVLPSYYREGGYPRALLEAMAYSKPVIAADTPECRGPVEDGRNGYLVPPQDSKALARAIEKIITNPELCREMGRQSLIRMKEEFDDQVVFKRIINEVLMPQGMQETVYQSL